MSDIDGTTPLPPPPPPNPRPRPDQDCGAPTSYRGPIVLSVSLLLLAIGIAAAVAGTLANSAAQDDRATAKRELQVSRDEVARADTARANGQDELASAESSARATLQLPLESVNPVARLLAINERQLEIFREQREVSLAPGRGVARFDQLIDEADALADEYNALADEYNELTDQLNGLWRSVAPSTSSQWDPHDRGPARGAGAQRAPGPGDRRSPHRGRRAVNGPRLPRRATRLSPGDPSGTTGRECRTGRT